MIWKDMVSKLRPPLIPIEGTENHQTRRGSFEISPFRQFSLSGCMELAFQSCREAEPLANAFGMLEAMAQNGNSQKQQDGKSVYVIGVDGEPEIAKIGVSVNAVKRLAALQGGHYRRLYLYAVIFAPTRKAISIEQRTLEWASGANCRLEGEWVACEPAFALLRCLEVARDYGYPAVDAATWFADMAARTYEIVRKSKRAA